MANVSSPDPADDEFETQEERLKALVADVSDALEALERGDRGDPPVSLDRARVNAMAALKAEQARDDNEVTDHD